MSLQAVASKAGTIGQVLKLLAADAPAAAFAQLLFGRDGNDGLDGLKADRLAALTRDALEFIARKPKAQHKVRIRTIPSADNGAAPGRAVLEILNDDMPFLVDSILGELQAHGLGVLALRPLVEDE